MTEPSMDHGPQPGRAATLAALADLARRARICGQTDNVGFPDAPCASPVDHRLVALCAELGAIERVRARLVSGLPVAAQSLGDLLIRRRETIDAICRTPACSVNGIKAKARAVRRVLGDAVLPKNMRDAVTRSLLADMEGAAL